MDAAIPLKKLEPFLCYFCDMAYHPQYLKEGMKMPCCMRCYELFVEAPSASSKKRSQP